MKRGKKIGAELPHGAKLHNIEPHVFPVNKWVSLNCHLGLFGVKRYGVHVNGYSRDENGELRMWLARRSITKQTHPGKLDNLVRFCVFDNFTNFTLQVNIIFDKCIMVL